MTSFGAHALHLLSIDLASAPSSLRAVLELRGEDVEHWLGRAQAAEVPLAIVCGPDSVDLYSTEEGRHVAFKPFLASLWSLGRNLEGFERVRTTEASGHAAARHLMRQAAGLASTEHGLSYGECIDQAYSLAALNGTLNVELQELFELASVTAYRSNAETELSAPHSTRASRQVEALSAERIMEEELIAFRVSAANDDDTRSSVPASAPSLPPRKSSGLVSLYAASEPGSSVRLRLAKLSLTPLPALRSG